MGAACSSEEATKTKAQPPPVGGQPGPAARRFQAIKDRFETVEEVQGALRDAGLESSDLILAVDLTKSNEWSGKHSFNGVQLCLLAHAAHLS
jgi:E3 ubiquitin-protein ligase RGLG